MCMRQLLPIGEMLCVLVISGDSESEMRAAAEKLLRAYRAARGNSVCRLGAGLI